MSNERRVRVEAICYVALALIWVIVPLRLYTRHCIVHNLGIDDMVMAAVLPLATAFLISTLLGSVGIPESELDENRLREAVKSFYIDEVVYLFATYLTKISVAFFLLRVAIDNRIRHLLRFLVASIIFWCLLYVILVLLQCFPIDAYWNSPDAAARAAHCWPSNSALALTYVGLGVIFSIDFAFVIIPIVMVWPLSLPRSRKLIIWGILALGAVSSCASIVRVFLMPSIVQKDEILFANADLTFWSIIEFASSIVSGSMACLRPLLQVLHHFFTRQGSRGPWSLRWQLMANRARPRTQNATANRPAVATDGDEGLESGLAAAQNRPGPNSDGKRAADGPVHDWLSKLSCRTTLTIAPVTRISIKESIPLDTSDNTASGANHETEEPVVAPRQPEDMA